MKAAWRRPSRVGSTSSPPDSSVQLLLQTAHQRVACLHHLQAFCQLRLTPRNRSLHLLPALHQLRIAHGNRSVQLLLQTAHQAVARLHHLAGFRQPGIALQQPVQLIERVLLQQCARSRARRRTRCRAQLRGKVHGTALRVLPEPPRSCHLLRSQCQPPRQRRAQHCRQPWRLQAFNCSTCFGCPSARSSWRTFGS